MYLNLILKRKIENKIAKIYYEISFSTKTEVLNAVL